MPRGAKKNKRMKKNEKEKSTARPKSRTDNFVLQIAGTVASWQSARRKLYVCNNNDDDVEVIMIDLGRGISIIMFACRRCTAFNGTVSGKPSPEASGSIWHRTYRCSVYLPRTAALIYAVALYTTVVIQVLSLFLT